MVLRRAELARTNNFDLIGDNGYEALREELSTDFPYLTLSDLNAIIKLGIKGKLDTYKARTLNFTRVYQWVEQRAVFSEGYWRLKHPALLDWADMTRTLDNLLKEIDTYETPAAAFQLDYKMRDLVQKVVCKTWYPQLGNEYNPLHNAETYPQEAANYRRIESEVYPQWLTKYPEFAGQHSKPY